MGRSPTGAGRRKLKRRPQRRRYLLACEGDKEVDYFKYLGKRMGGAVVLRPLRRWSDPGHVVELASQERDADRRAAREAGDPFDVYDGVWAVVDIDTHSHLLDAVADAARAGIEVAVSGPCFETWLILHLEDRTAAFSTSKDAKDRWAQLVTPGRTAAQEFGQLAGKATKAIDRANALMQRHARNQIPRHQRNPSSEVGAVIATICAETRVDPRDL